MGLYSLSCAYVLWRGRAEPLLSRWPLIVLTALGGGLFLAHSARDVVPARRGTDRQLRRASIVWLRIVSTFTLLYFIAINYLFLALTKNEASSRTSAPR